MLRHRCSGQRWPWESVRICLGVLVLFESDVCIRKLCKAKVESAPQETAQAASTTAALCISPASTSSTGRLRRLT